jgi:Intracellular proteinase inhibitor
MLAIAGGTAFAIDVNPSKETIPRSSFDTGGNRFSIFNGDPKRIQRANEVDCKAFTAKVQISPNPLSLKEAESIGPNPSIKISFSIQNHSKKTFTLSFPTAQRWDFRIVDAANNAVYTYTNDHEFVQVVGTSMVNQDDKLSYNETIEFEDLTTPLAPGSYTILAVMANYPEIKAQTQFTVQP